MTWNIPHGSPFGLPDGVTTIAEALKSMGYSTYMTGAWDLGHSQWKLTPVGKGFDEFSGCFTTGADPVTKSYYDSPWHELGKDWIQAYSGGEYTHISPSMPTNEASTTEALRMMQAHSEMQNGGPLLVYISYSTAAPHAYEVDRCQHIANLWRRQHCTAMVVIDDGVGAIADAAVKILGKDTVFIFTSTNGGSWPAGGLNGKFRGGGGSVLEGGVHVPAFSVDFNPDGSHLSAGRWAYNGLTHICDWFPTILSIANGPVKVYTNSGGDGLDMTITLKYYRDRKPHRDITLIEMHDKMDQYYDESSFSFISGDLKFIQGVVRDSGLYTEASFRELNAGTSYGETLIRILERIFGSAQLRPLKSTLAQQLLIPKENSHEHLYLFNVSSDTQEANDLALFHPDIIATLQEQANMFKSLRKLPQRQHFLQCDSRLIYASLVVGNCSLNRVDNKETCLFLHPWIADNEEPFDAKLLNALEADNVVASHFVISLPITIMIIALATIYHFSRKLLGHPAHGTVQRPKQ